MNEPAKIEKVTDDALSRSIFSSVIGIIICMVCLVGTTWAWYSLSIESGANMTEGANFDFTVEITDNVTPDDDGTYTLTGGTYTVTLTKAEGCTATKGFCKVIATKNGEVDTIYYTVDFANTGSIKFTVKGSGTLMLIPMLGTPAGGYGSIPVDGIELTLPALNALPPTKAVVEQEETTSEEDDPIDYEPDDKENDDSTDGKGTTGPDEDDENVNENEVPDETPANPEQTEQEPSEESEPAETEQTEIPPETTTQE